ncbi:GAP family protein [Agromyces sp. SYSU K20354]|uniref:GAP family protein n=1 Tax=Agromyces cavernae TaxID=2898659 RepID=UPI001E52784E|nr:GAP family protein [Agromyces cavernae]MCD2441853.1 GAP family protein [Agromyces cavernae]
MDFLTDAQLELSLAALALLDGLSIGTLLIPVFLLLAPRLRGGRVLLYLVTIAGFYLVVGVLFTLGMVNLVEVGQDLLNSPAGLVVRLVIGVALLLVAIAMPTSEKQRTPVAATAGDHGANPAGEANDHGEAVGRAAEAPVPAPGGRISRWRDRLLSDAASPANVMAVAVAAGLIEVATMLPYLVAMGMIAEAELAMPVRIAALAAYCAVMIAPALVLLALRLIAAPLVKRPLERLAEWLERTAAENTAWILGILGFLVAVSAASELGIFDAIDALT